MTVHLLIKGKVQGVFYRAAAGEAARRVGVNGWVKNTPGEDVEAVASGEESKVKEFIEWCKEGPFGATVTEVIVTNTEDEDYDEFTVIR